MNFALHGIAQRRGLFLVMEAEVREMAGFFFRTSDVFEKDGAPVRNVQFRWVYTLW